MNGEESRHMYICVLSGNPQSCCIWDDCLLAHKPDSAGILQLLYAHSCQRCCMIPLCILSDCVPPNSLAITLCQLAHDCGVALCRPLLSQGTSDELAHVLGHTQVQLGCNMVASTKPFPSSPSPAEDVVLYFGIIDILQVRGA